MWAGLRRNNGQKENNHRVINQFPRTFLLHLLLLLPVPPVSLTFSPGARVPRDDHRHAVVPSNEQTQEVAFSS